MNIVHCKECKQQVPTVDIKFMAFQMCPECKFWHDFVLLREDKNSVRVKGKQFWVGREDAHPHDKGMRGDKFTIQPIDRRSKSFTTTNLNYCGDIPEAFQSRLKDNAEFILSGNVKP